jgi:hypothetical protein
MALRSKSGRQRQSPSTEERLVDIVAKQPTAKGPADWGEHADDDEYNGR